MCRHEDDLARLIKSSHKHNDLMMHHEGRPINSKGSAKIIRATLVNSDISQAVGIKCILKEGRSSDVKLQHSAFEREIAVWSSLDNPNVLRLLGTVELDQEFKCYLLPAPIFDYYSDGDIIQYNIISKPSDQTRLKLAHEAAKGLMYIHSQKIVHGDVKGVNILVDPYGHAKLCDFGSAYTTCLPCCVAGPPKEFAPLVSELYLSPELVQEEDLPTTAKSDIWAFGCALLEVQTGSHPYKGLNFWQALMKQSTGGPPADSSSFSSGAISEQVGRVAFKCWQPDPMDRPSAEAVATMLGDIVERYSNGPSP